MSKLSDADRDAIMVRNRDALIEELQTRFGLRDAVIETLLGLSVATDDALEPSLLKLAALESLVTKDDAHELYHKLNIAVFIAALRLAESICELCTTNGGHHDRI